MPTVIQIGAYRIEIHTGREWDSPHVHVVSGGKDVIVSLITLQEMGEVPFRMPKDVRQYVEDNRVSMLAAWDKYHGE